MLRVPEAIGLDVAAPLMCAGITLYSPLRHWNAGPDTRVAIIGFGGLGHMGVRIADALGAEVTVLTQTLSKQEDGLRLGADHYVATADTANLKPLRRSFDQILNTVSAPLPMDYYLALLKLDGTMVNVGAPPEPISVRAGSMIKIRRSISGSAIGGCAETQEMRDFCAGHGFCAEIETITAAQIDEAYDRVVDSKVRYRFVIDTATI